MTYPCLFTQVRLFAVQFILALPPRLVHCTVVQGEGGRSWVKEAKVIPIATFHTRCLRHAACVRCRPGRRSRTRLTH